MQQTPDSRPPINDPKLLSQARRRRLRAGPARGPGAPRPPRAPLSARTRWVAAAIALCLGLGALGYLSWPQLRSWYENISGSTASDTAAVDTSIISTSTANSEEDPELANDPSHGEDDLPPAAFGPPDPFVWATVPVRKGDTLFGALTENGVSRAEANRIVSATGSVYDLRKVKPGQEIDVQFFGDSEIVAAVYRISPLTEIRMNSYNQALTATRVDLTPDVRIRGARIKVESSLYASFEKESVPTAVLLDMAELFAWSIDFSNAVREGDTLEILWEELWLNGKYFRPGRILAATYAGEVVTSDLYHFTVNNSNSWFHEDGLSVQAAFLKAPVSFSRISSGYSTSRMHPVLGHARAHRGVDFAAPIGTPVFSVSDGVVIGAGVMGGAGKAVRIRHNNGWITSYSHLSKISVQVGQRVRQKQIVGLVGSTGLSSGPHLDYRIKIGSDFVDPLRVKLPQGQAVPSAFREAYQTRVQELRTMLAAEIRRPVGQITAAQ